tara:strand:+ start:26505 stop:27605 length:1101 start_codon:yes stop_codon:yes gene_type:complete
MKICIVCPYGIDTPGGVWNHVFNLTQQLQIKRINHILVTPESKTHNYYQSNHYKIGKTFKINSAGSKSEITFSPFINNKIKNLIREYDPDIIHIHEPFAGSLPISFLLNSQSKNIATFHSNQGTNLYKFGLNKIFKPLDEKLNVRIAVSKTAKHFINTYFQNTYKIIPNGINVDFFKNATPIDEIKDDKLNIIFIGRNDPRKGLKILISTLQKYIFDFPVRLIILGNKITNLKIDNVDILNPGFVNENSKAKYLQSSDILCAPSLEKESFGIILLEAMASNTAIIASDIEGYNEIITNNVNGLLIEPNNINQLAQSIKRLHADKNQKQKLISNANSHMKNLNWDNISDKIINIYKNTLNHKETSEH